MAHRPGRERLVALVVLLATATALALLGANQPRQAAAQGGGVGLQRIGGFEAPVYARQAPGQPKLLFVVEQPGAIRVVRKGKTLRQPFVDLSNVVSYGGEEGLLSVAFDPDYERNRRFYVYYVTKGGNIRVDVLRRKRSSATRADAGSRRKVIEIPHPVNSNHNGGQVQFGPDGYLYLALGDGGSGGDPRGNAQNPESLLGKLLRIEPKPKGGYSVPDSNPFAGGAGSDEIFATGLRNPYRFSFDSQSGALSIGDVGQDSWEEIDYVGADRARGANFGWDLFEGTHVYDGDGSQPANYVPPIHEYSLDGGTCAVTAGPVVHDPGLPSLAGRLVYADFCAGEVRSLDPGAANPASTDTAAGFSVDSPSSFVEGLDGKIYVTSLDGGVYRLR